LILTDDQGWWDVGAYGNPYIETPSLDRLTREGVRFSHFYASPVCTPSRASLLTGRYYQRTGALDRALDKEVMNSEEITLGELFQQQGYRTALIGKWHLGRYMKYHPNNQGFEEFFGFWQYAFINHYLDSEELFHNKEPVVTTGYITDVLTDRAIAFMKQDAARPFFLYLAYNAPHSPYLVPDQYIEKYLKKGLPLGDARIYGMVTSLDKNISRILQTMEELGTQEQTIMIFMSDNGGISRSFRAGLRGGKGSVYEGGVRVPFIGCWPGHFAKGAIVHAEAQHIDIFPTLCNLAGIPLPKDLKIDGKSIASLLTQGEGVSPHKYLFHQWKRLEGPRTGPERRAIYDVETGYKLVQRHPEDLNPDPTASERVGGELSPYELFDLRHDPGENKDLSGRYPEVVQEMRKRFEDWLNDVTSGQDWSRVPVPIEIGRADENPVEISLLWGQLVGKKVHLTFHNYIADTIDNWSEVEDYVRWKIQVIQSGRYEVILSYGCHPKDSGSRVLIRAGKSEVTHVVQGTADRNIYRSLSPGTLSLHRGAAELQIKPLSIVSRELMTLNKVWLKRVK
jgi:arylsulfatase A